MKKWQILEFDGKPYYAFVPEEEDTPLPDEEEMLEQIEQVELDENSFELKEELAFDEVTYYDSADEKAYDDSTIFNGDVGEQEEEEMEDEEEAEEEEEEERDIKPITLNGINEDKPQMGDLYQVKVQGSMVTLEKIMEKTAAEQEQQQEKEQEQEQEQEQQQTKKKNEETGEYQAEEMYDYEMAEIADIEYLEDEITEPCSVVEDDNVGSPAKASAKSPKSTSATLKCRVCSEMFDTEISFRKHVAWTHKKKVCIKEDGAYICAVCDYRTMKKSLFAAHLERKHETWSRKRPTSMKFPCAACGFVCRSKHSLQSHFIRKHTDRYEHHCNFCPKKFKEIGRAHV